jgi:hypothetical protein
MMVGMWLAWNGSRKTIPGVALVVILASAVATMILLVGMGWLWGYFGALRPDALPPDILRTEAMWKAFRSDTQMAGWLIYGAAITIGLVLAAVGAWFFGASTRRSLALTALVFLIFFLTPGFIWLEVNTSCVLGDAAILRGADLCH